MGLLPSEVARLKYELGFNVLSVGAEPYIGVAALFEQVIQPYVTGGATTTSSTPVAGSGQPSLVTLTLADATGFAAGAAVIVDVDSLQERATVRHIAGATIQILLSKAHVGTYPVTVEGGESLIRAILQRLQALDGLGASNGEGGVMGGAIATSGIKKIDEIEFFGGDNVQANQMAQLIRQRDYWRDELASILGIERLNRGRGGGGSDCAVY